MSTSPYSKLEQTGCHFGRDVIRLMRLEPGQKEDPIYASLVTRPLKSDQPEYEALSYVWGDPSMGKTIRLCGQEFSVTTNLEAALRQIRRVDETRTLWVDAICINQADILERNSQVLFMDKIYRKSTKVLVWLGPGKLEAKGIVAFLKSMNDNEHICPCVKNDSSICGNGLTSLRAILNQSWWERTWTLQEILLARDAEILCGNFQVPWEDFYLAFSNIEEHMYVSGCCANVQICSECQKYFNFRELVGGLHEQRQRLKQSQGLNLFDLLPQYRYRQVTEPRDKVYALLGLVDPDQSSRFDPNYSCRVEDLFIKTAVCNISWCRSLQSLHFAANIESSLNIPSWVTDWDSYRQGGIKTALQTRYEMYDAARGVEWSGTFRGMESEPFSNCTFSTDGIWFDKVRLIGELSDFEQLKDNYVTLKQWLSLVMDYFKVPDLAQPYIGGGELKNAFWRTLTVDVVVSATRGKEIWYKRASECHGEDFWSWWTAVLGGALEISQGSAMNALLANITTAISRRRFFITDKGYIGNGPAKMQPGDEIFILCGGKMPLVLRPDLSERFQQGLSQESRPLHALVGDCYIHGIMDGEAASNFEYRSQPVCLK